MLGSGNNLSSSSSSTGISSSDMPPLPQCLPLDPITLGNKKYTRSGELRRVLGVPLGSTSGDHSFRVPRSKLMEPVASGELKHFKESVQDVSKKAGNRAKLLGESISKLDKYREALNSKKRQRTDSPSDRGSGITLTKMGSQIHRNPDAAVIQRSVGKTASSMMSKRTHTLGTDIRVESRSASSIRQQIVMVKDGNLTRTPGGGSLRIEEKTRRLLAGGEGLDQKIKKKRSVGAVGNRVINGERDIKQGTLPKTSADLKLRFSDAQGFRLKSQSGAGGINKSEVSLEPNSGARTILEGEQEGGSLFSSEHKVLAKGNHRLNTQEDCPTSSPNTVIKTKGARAPRTGSVTALESCSVQPSSGTSTGSSIHPMTQWVGQRPHKNSRSRRANVISPVSRNVEAQVSSEVCPTSDTRGRAYSVGVNGSQLTSSRDNNTQKNKRLRDDISSPFGLSESEESGAGESKVKDKAIYSRDFSVNVEKAGASKLQMRKNKIPTDESGDFLQRQGRNGRSLSLIRPDLPSGREKSEDVSITKPAQHIRPNDKNKIKHGRPPSKKQKDHKVLTRVGKILNNGSSDFAGESDDDHEELYQAAISARNANRLACSSPFWKKMEPIFGSISLEDASYLKQQLSLAGELDESLSQVFGTDHDILGVIINKEATHGSGEQERSDCNQESIKTNALCGKNVESVDKVNPLFQRVLSALIEDGIEDSFHHSEAKNMSRQCASDDSHCGSCDQIDLELKDRDKMDSEVESMVDYQIQKNYMVDRLSCDKSAASNSLRCPNTSNSSQSTGVWQGDGEFLHSDITHTIDVCSNDLDQLQTAELRTPGFPSLDGPYQLLCLDDKLLLELKSIGLYPEILPDLAEEDETIYQEITELKKGLHQQIGRKKKNLVRIDRAIQKGRDTERRKNEQVAYDQLVERTYRKRLQACCGSKNSKSALQKVSKQASLALVKRTLGRCKKYEETGNSCFSESSLQNIIFSLSSFDNDDKSADCIVSGTASNTYNKSSNQVEAKKSVSSASEKNDSYSDNVDQGLPDSSQFLTHTAEHLSSKNGSVIIKEKRREMLVNGVLGSSYSRSSNLDGTGPGGIKGKRSDRERNQSRQNSTSNGGCQLLDSSQNEPKTKKHKSNNVGYHGSSQPAANAGNCIHKEGGAILPGNQDTCKVTESTEFGNLQLNDLDSMEDLGVSGELGGPQDITTWLSNIVDDDGLQEDELINGLEIPMDDISELGMF